MVCDHIIPLSKQGKSIPKNLQMICKTCNTRKGALKEKDALLELIRELCEGPQGTLPDGTKLLDVFGNKELEEELERQHPLQDISETVVILDNLMFSDLHLLTSQNCHPNESFSILL